MLEFIVTAVARRVPLMATVAHVVMPPGNKAIHYLKLGNHPFEPLPSNEWIDYADAYRALACRSDHAVVLHSPLGSLKVLGALALWCS